MNNTGPNVSLLLITAKCATDQSRGNEQDTHATVDDVYLQQRLVSPTAASVIACLTHTHTHTSQLNCTKVPAVDDSNRAVGAVR